MIYNKTYSYTITTTTITAITGPLVKAECKWRYNMYKSWLKFLDVSIADSGFETMNEDFSD